jgi:hypothetical protein
MKSFNELSSFLRLTLRLINSKRFNSLKEETYWRAKVILVATGLVEDSPFVLRFGEAMRIEVVHVS